MPQPLNGHNADVAEDPADDMTAGELAAAAASADDGSDDAGINIGQQDPEEKAELGRRAKARAEYERRNRRLDDLEAKIERSQGETAAQLAARDAEIARLREENQRILGRHEAAQQAEPDPDDLRRQAREALKAEKLDDYERLRDEATRIEVRREIRAATGAIAERIPQSPPASVTEAQRHIDALRVSHKSVRSKGDAGMRLVAAKYQELGIVDGMADGPDRMERAFELAEAQLSSRQQRSSRDPDARAALTGSRTSSEAGDDGETKMDPLAKKLARMARISDEDYMKNM